MRRSRFSLPISSTFSPLEEVLFMQTEKPIHVLLIREWDAQHATSG